MNDETTPQPTDPIQQPSGNRWEPSAEAAPTAPEPMGPPEAPGTRTSPWSRGRAAVAGAAAASLLVAGVGGFAVGRATGGDGDPGIQQVGFQPGDDGDGDGDDRGFGDRDGGPPPGGVPQHLDDDGGDAPDGSDT